MHPLYLKALQFGSLASKLVIKSNGHSPCVIEYFSIIKKYFAFK